MRAKIGGVLVGLGYVSGLIFGLWAFFWTDVLKSLDAKPRFESSWSETRPQSSRVVHPVHPVTVTGGFA